MRALAVAVLALAPAIAHADSALRPEQIPQRARELADRGRALHDKGDYSHAIAAFKEAYVLAPSPGLLFNLAQSYRLAGDCDNAAWMYRRYLDTNPMPAQRSLAEGHLATVDKCRHGTLQISLAPTHLETAGRAAQQRDALAVFDGHDDHAARPSKKKQVGLYLAIGGGAALAVAGYFALDAHAASSDVEEAYRKGGNWKDIRAIDERGQRSSMLAGVFGVAGLAAAGTGGVLYFLGRHEEHARQIAVVPGAHGAHVSVSWHF